MKNKVRSYLTILGVLVSIAIIGTFSAVALANPGERNVSNPLTLVGTSGPQPPPAPVLTLAWKAVGGGTISDSGATVTWFVGTPYIVEVRATNSVNTASGIYGKLTGWKTDELKVEFNNPATPGVWTDLGSADPIAVYCGFFTGSVYYFGPKGGDSYTTSQSKVFELRVTPLKTVSPISLTLVLVDGVTDPRP